VANYFGLGSNDPTEQSELLTAKALRSLGPDWTVLHHVAWQAKRGGRQGDGEADFLVIHPQLGILVIEVKGGGIQVTNGRWQSMDRHGNVHDIKNPYEQATSSKHALVKWLKERGLSARARIGHAVVFPHLASLPNLGPAATPEITLIQSSLHDIDSALRKCMSHWEMSASLREDEIRALVSLLAPTVAVRRRLADHSAAAAERLIELTAEQIEAFALLRANRGGLVVGGAGTGKTFLAVARAQQLQRDGFRTLLVCYNELLGSDLSKRVVVDERLVVETFHSLCFREARKAKLPIPPVTNQEWWENGAPALLMEACSISDSCFDAIVIDEAQDFSPEWIEALKSLTSKRDESPFFAFADSKQDLWNRNWMQGDGYPFVNELRRNLRNTYPIAQRVSATHGEQVHRPYGPDGPPARWKDIAPKTAPEESAIAAIEYLIDEGFGPGNLVVLCSSARLASSLRERSIGPYSCGSWGGRGIAVETIGRFKGMESDAVVLVLESDHRTNQEEVALAYVGISRARTLLSVVGSQSIQSRINWLKNDSVEEAVASGEDVTRQIRIEQTT